MIGLLIQNVTGPGTRCALLPPLHKTWERLESHLPQLDGRTILTTQLPSLYSRRAQTEEFIQEEDIHIEPPKSGSGK